MPRIADIDDQPMTSQQRKVFDAIASGPRGAVEGPLRIWLHSPELAQHSQALGAFCRYGTSLTPRLSELAIIAIGAFWRAGFEWFIHAPIAEAAGISPVAIQALKAGEAPRFENRDEEAVYRFTRQLITRRTVSDDTYAAARACLSEPAIVELVGIIGYYSYIAMTINAFEVVTPGGDPFAESP